MRSDHLFNVWCGAKPVLALYVVRLLEERGLGPDEAVAGWVEGHRELVGDLTFGDLLAHRAGLGEPPALSVMLADDPRQEMESALRRPLPGSAQYSEVSGWALLRRAAAGLLRDEDVEACIERDVLVPLGIQDELIVCSRRALAAENLDTYWGALPTGPEVPLLHDLTERFRRATSAVIGARASARAIARFLAAAMSSDTPARLPTSATLETWLTRPMPPAFDGVLMCPSAFAAGMWLDPAAHGLGGVIPDGWVMTIGWEGLLVGAADPTTGTAVCCLRTTLPAEEGEVIAWQRAVLAGLLDRCPA